jgi:hypothetical protein
MLKMRGSLPPLLPPLHACRFAIIGASILCIITSRLDVEEIMHVSDDGLLACSLGGMQ